MLIVRNFSIAYSFCTVSVQPTTHRDEGQSTATHEITSPIAIVVVVLANHFCAPVRPAFSYWVQGQARPKGNSRVLCRATHFIFMLQGLRDTSTTVDRQKCRARQSVTQRRRQSSESVYLYWEQWNHGSCDISLVELSLVGDWQEANEQEEEEDNSLLAAPIPSDPRTT